MRTRLFLVMLCLLLLPQSVVFAQVGPRQVEAVITEIRQTEVFENGSRRFEFEAASKEGEIFHVDTRSSLSETGALWFKLDVGDRVQLRVVTIGDKSEVYFEDLVRTHALWAIVIFFVLLTIGVGLLRGLLAIVGFVFTTAVLFGFLFPQILAGRNPMFMTAIASIVILAMNIHLAHGLHKRTFFAFLGTSLGVVLTAVFAYIFAYGASLSGLGSEEVNLLLWDVPTIVNPIAIFLCAILLGAVGVLDDIAVTQSEIVSELQSVNPDLSRRELFTRAMRVGRHHIASTVNTLILVYVGASMPMFLLAMHYSVGTDVFLNAENVAEEIVRIIAGTSALVLTVPIATAFATIPRESNQTPVSHH